MANGKSYVARLKTTQFLSQWFFDAYLSEQ